MQIVLNQTHFDQTVFDPVQDRWEYNGLPVEQRDDGEWIVTSAASVDHELTHSASSDANSPSYTFAGVSLGVADDDRKIVVCVASRASGGTTSLASSMTVAGQTATLLAESQHDDGTTTGTSIYVCDLPTGATGDVVVNYPATQLRCGIAVYRVIGAADAIVDSSIADGELLPSLSATADAKSDGLILASCVAASGASIEWSGANEDHEEYIESHIVFSTASYSPSADETDRSLAATFSGNTDAAMVAVSFAAAATAGGGGARRLAQRIRETYPPRALTTNV